MAEMRNIRVTVTNVSASHRLAPAYVTETVVKQLNAHSNGQLAFAGDDTKNADGVLALSILEESGRLTHADPQSDTVKWQFRIKFSATLTRADGQIIMSRPMRSVTSEPSWTGFTKAGVTPGWDEPPTKDGLVWGIGDRLVGDLVHLK
jgi:hypothetical protein